MVNLNINKLYSNLKEVKAYKPPYNRKHHRLRQIMHSIFYRGEMDFSMITIKELERLIDIYNKEHYQDINAIEASLKEADQIITTLQNIPPRRVRNVFL